MHTLETEARPHACLWVGRTALTPEQGGMRCRPPRCPAQEQDGEATPPSSDHKPNKAKPEEATQEGGGEGGTKDPGEAGREGAVGEEGGGKARTQQETPVFVLVKPSGYFCSFKRKEAQQEREGQQLPVAHCSRW